MAIGGLKTFIPFAMLASCSAPAPSSAVILVTYDHQADRCLLTRGAQVVRIDSDEDIKRAAAVGRNWPERVIKFEGPGYTPYRCVGAAIIVAQKAEKQFSFTAEPPPVETNAQ